MTPLMAKLDELEATAKEATPGTRTVRDDNEGMEPQFGQMWVVENEDNKTEDEEAIPLECAVYYGCKADADLIAICDPATILQLTQALRLAVEALKECKKREPFPNPKVKTALQACSHADKNPLWISPATDALLAITQLGLGEGGNKAVLKYKFSVDHTANGTEEYFSEKPTLSIAEVISMVPGQSPFYNTFLKVLGKEDEQLFPLSAIDLRNDPHIYFTPPCTDRPGRSR